MWVSRRQNRPVLMSEKVKEIRCEYILSAREQILQEIIINQVKNQQELSVHYVVNGIESVMTRAYTCTCIYSRGYQNVRRLVL